MKKGYKKPLVYAESFELIDHIAGECQGLENYVTGDFNITHRNSGECGIWDANIKLFQSGVADCNTKIFENFGMEPTLENAKVIIGAMEGGTSCYNAFLGTNLFAS
jgi:hypothetical protein